MLRVLVANDQSRRRTGAGDHKGPRGDHKDPEGDHKGRPYVPGNADSKSRVRSFNTP